MTNEELKKRRQALLMTQGELAYELGVQQNTIARWESGNYRIPHMASLAMDAIECARPENNVPMRVNKTIDKRAEMASKLIKGA